MKLLLGLLLFFASPAFAGSSVDSHLILNAAIATGSGANTQNNNNVNTTFQCYGVTSAGAGAATIVIEVSDLPLPATATSVDWITAGTITLTLSTTRSSDGFVLNAPWRWYRARVSAISGTDATVSCYAGKVRG
jgi:hypothetical protein